MNQTSLVLTQEGYEYIYPIDEKKAVQNIGAAILALFEKNRMRAGQSLPFRTLQFSLFNNLNPKETSLIPNAIERLMEEGLVTEQDGPLPSLILTAAGYDKLY